MHRRILAALTLALLLPALALAQSLTPEAKARTIADLQQAINRRAFVPGVDFSKIPAALEKRKADLDAASDARAFAGVINGALRELGISHIRLLTPTAARQRTSGQTLGFGLTAAPGGEGLTVAALAPGSHASKLGLAEGDIIVEVEGRRPTSPADIEQDGRETTLLKVRRKADGRERYVMLLRQAYSTDRKPTLTWPAPGVARLMLPSFTRGYAQPELEKLLSEAAEAKALILDLRNNGGGLVNNSAHLLSLLLPPGTPTGISVSREMTEQFARETGGDPKDVFAVARWRGPTRRTTARKVSPFKGKVVVLMNRRSASASEIVSAVLREERGATLIGTPTAGAVLTSVFQRLSDGWEVQLPVTDYVTPRGVRLEKNPIKPDIVVEGNAPRGGSEADDPYIQAALKALASAKPQPVP